MLFNFFLRLTGNRAASEDLVQDVFIRILKYRATYQGESKFVVWMFKIARNAHIDHLRKRKTRRRSTTSSAEPPSRHPRPEDRSRPRRKPPCRRALARAAPRRNREILVLSRFQDLKYREIADLLDCPVGTVKARSTGRSRNSARSTWTPGRESRHEL